MRAIAILLLSALVASSSLAATLTCDGSQADCQAKVTAAVDGDVVSIPAGTFTWASTDYISWNNKNITVQGQGEGATTIISRVGFVVSDTTKASFRITGMTLQVSGTAIQLSSIATSSAVYGWRIDHITINSTYTMGIYVEGINWGLIDHCTFNGNFNGVEIYAYVNADFPLGADGEGAASWALPLHLGSAEAVYVEDCTFNGTGGGLGVNDMQFGARMVFRYNTVTNTYIQSHSARSSIRGGSLKFEIYANTFTGAGFLRWSLMLAGTGVVFNNTISGYATNNLWLGDQRASQQFTSPQYLACDGTHAWDGNIEGTGWPCLDQIGRGPGALGSQPSAPLYIWNNGTEVGCSTGGACGNAMGVTLNSNPVNLAPYITTTAHGNGEKDYCLAASMPASCGTSTNAYLPYVYPHPLQGAAPGAPAASVSTRQTGGRQIGGRR